MIYPAAWLAKRPLGASRRRHLGLVAVTMNCLGSSFNRARARRRPGRARCSPKRSLEMQLSSLNSCGPAGKHRTLAQLARARARGPFPGRAMIIIIVVVVVVVGGGGALIVERIGFCRCCCCCPWNTLKVGRPPEERVRVATTNNWRLVGAFLLASSSAMTHELLCLLRDTRCCCCCRCGSTTRLAFLVRESFPRRWSAGRQTTTRCRSGSARGG